jgi:hypothetical protein
MIQSATTSSYRYFARRANFSAIGFRADSSAQSGIATMADAARLA